MDNPSPRQLTLDDWGSEQVEARPRSAEAQTPTTAGPEDTSVIGSVGSLENGLSRQAASSDKAVGAAAQDRRTPTALLDMSGALLTRTHLRELGLERRAIDAVFRKLPVVALPGYSRPMIHVEQYLELIDEHTYRDDRVRPRHA